MTVLFFLNPTSPPQTTEILTFCQDLITSLKPDLQLNGSGTSQTMCHKIQTAPDMTIRAVQNPFTTVQLFINTDYKCSKEFLIFVKCAQH